MAWQRCMTNKPRYTRNGNTQAFFKVLLANILAHISLAKANYMAKSRSRVGRTTQLHAKGQTQQSCFCKLFAQSVRHHLFSGSLALLPCSTSYSLGPPR
jgi:hypothetical protein